MGDAGANDDALWTLTQAATHLLGSMYSKPAEGADSADARLARLRQIQADVPLGIQVATDGPYLVSNAANVYDWLGGRIQPLPQMALCRCGASAIKPLCDGSHARVGFSGEKDTKRVPDRRDTYVGQQVTIFDNRGICQHSGFRTDRLAAVFHTDTEPFVTPSGGRMDEIIRAARDCPSGALSYAIDGVEARTDVDQHGKREPAIEVTKDGPYRVTGGIPPVNGDGSDQARNQGSSREHYALCRCGHSQNKIALFFCYAYMTLQEPKQTRTHARRAGAKGGKPPRLPEGP